MIFAKIAQSVKMSLKSINGNKGRSALTMLGIVIGVSSVILLTGIGGGATKSITDSLSELGTRLITVNVNRRASSRTVDLEDLQGYVKEHPELVKDVSPYVSGSVQAKVGSTNTTTTLDGVDTNYESIRSLELTAGRFIGEIDVSKRAYVAVVGTYIQKELFGGMNPVGQVIKLNGKQFTIIGVYKEVGDSSESSDDNKITIPYTTATRFLKNKYISTFYIEALTEDVVERALDDIDQFMAKRLGEDSGYRVFSISQVMDMLDEMMGTLTAMLAGIAAISLVVGGVGIMNIMTVTVSERTREIGIRKAIGARTTDILLQFLIESIILSAFGGVIGIGVGIGLGCMIAPMLGLEFVTQLHMVLMSFSFAILIGIFFGIAPARKAAKMHPIEALRSE